MSSGEKFIVIEFEGPSFMSSLETIYIYIHIHFTIFKTLSYIISFNLILFLRYHIFIDGEKLNGLSMIT